MAGCVVLPLTSYSGAVVGFQTRSIQGKVFDSFSLSRRPEGYFFGAASNMGPIWSTRKVVVVEGPFDHLVIERLVTRNVVALITNTANRVQTKFFRRFVESVDLLLDKDVAGRDGAESLQAKLQGGPYVRTVKFDVKDPSGARCKDPNEAWKAMGDVRFSRYFTQLLDVVRY
jgi:DNA primase